MFTKGEPMRLILSVLFTLSTLSFGVGLAYGEVMCPEPVASPTSSPEATPQAQIPPEGNFHFEGGELTVFAAASLTDAYNEIATVLMEQNEGLNITIETAGSQTLVTQIEEGASADVLATANTSTMDRAVESNLIAGEPIMFTGNRLVIVTPVENPAGIEGIDDLAGEDIRLVLANPDVPAGNYANIAFCNYAMVDGSPEGFVDSINGNIVSEEVDVRTVLAKVQLGEADAGVVYASDAVASELNGVPLNVIEFPDSVSTRADYPIAAIEGGDEGAANAFINFVVNEEGQAILKKYGFE